MHSLVQHRQGRMVRSPGLASDGAHGSAGKRPPDGMVAAWTSVAFLLFGN